MTAKAISHVNEWVCPDWISSAWVSADARLGSASGWDRVPLVARWVRSGLGGMATGLTRMLGAVLGFAVAATVFFTLIGAQGIARTFGWVGSCDGAGSTVFMAKERETLVSGRVLHHQIADLLRIGVADAASLGRQFL